ncbi:SusC/RagA family TonB-linked outer membrane protein [Parapedobacter sp. 10938]|uniref:SusC/RagA family TonB-linked outer membrane protein n=1 Tax=Parapedobacter flavus TaxID=3110225 RepID=UPI002DB9D229|nr:TonB-dependent receptor [Parapedobacter sp. 10938]MEC3878147.1 TonB-dependent receptor [Parapedobacter sp. 10938]
MCHLLAVCTVQAQHQITGVVVHAVDGSPLAGVSVSAKNTQYAVATGDNGRFSINVPNDRGILVFTYVGFEPKEESIGGRPIVNVELAPDEDLLDEVVVVAFGEQKKESMVSSITTVNPKELKGPTSNLTSMLAGRVSGMIAYQSSGEPGADNAQFFIRGITTFGSGKIDPLILIDGIESTSNALARLQPDDIAGFSVLKDAAAASLYGARGANGVVLVTTKSGVNDRTHFNFRLENSISQNTTNFNLADNITYMQLANEAVLTRNPIGALPYTQNKIDKTAAGENTLLYPSNNWLGMLIKDYTANQRFNMNVRGGGRVAQFYISGTYNRDNGMLKSNNKNNFDNNIDLKNYEVRSNVNVMLTPSTEGIVRTSGNFTDYTGPVGGGSAVFRSATTANPVLFPAVFPAADISYAKHPLFGNAPRGDGDAVYANPYASMVSGFQQYSRTQLNVQLEIKQDFNFLTEGLNARLMAYTQRYSYFSLERQYNPFYYFASPNNFSPSGYSLRLLNENNATEYLNYNEGGKIVNTTAYLETAVNYNRTFGQKHAVSGMLIGIFRNHVDGNAGNLQSSLPFRNQGLSGRFTYGYDSRYLFEANFGFNGSERFAKNNRFGFFPSAGVAWNINNEPFFEPLLPVVSKLKLRATYGLVGNDQIGDPDDRFFYMSNVTLNDNGRRTVFGENYDYVRPGVSVSRYANDDVTWEKAYKTNIGMDLELFNQLNMIVDVFHERRTNILMGRSYIPTTMGLTAGIAANVGEAEGKGIDMELDYGTNFGPNWLRVRGTFTYATSKLLVNEEPEYPANMQYLSRVGHSLQQYWGLIAERLFIDDEDVRNSPPQAFGEVRGGDIKYRDLNGDGEVTNLDRVNGLGYPMVPEIIYGAGFSFGTDKFDISAFFQGSAHSSLFIDPAAISPFVMSGARQNGLLQVIAEDHWSETNRNSYAFWPRLSATGNSNNNQASTWWMRNGAFVRLKSVELGYNFSGKALQRMNVSGVRFYVNGVNLFLISSFKMWDPEQGSNGRDSDRLGSNGLGYPPQKVFNIGVNIQL